MIPIYVVQQQHTGQYQQLQDMLDRDWWPFLLQCNLHPILLPNDTDLLPLILQQAQAKAILLTGGGTFSVTGEDARSATEIALLRWSLLSDTPVIGVCRGMQAMLQYCGATLQKVTGHVTPKQQIIFQDKARFVNSYHDYGFNQVPANFTILARAGDNTIKAVQATDRKWLGIMWHPERFEKCESDDINLFSQFIKESLSCKD